MKTVHIFDLDGTVIDSSKRVVPCLRPNGDLDLEKYIAEACTHEKVKQDTLLPLAEHMKQLIAEGEEVVICTARYMNKTDYVYLRKNGLRVPRIMSRDQLKRYFSPERASKLSAGGDSVYKGAYFNILKALYSNAKFIMYDDHQGVLKAAHDAGFYTVDAITMNSMLNECWKDGYEAGDADAVTEHVELIEMLSGVSL